MKHQKMHYTQEELLEDLEKIKKLQKQLPKEFETKDLGKFTYFLGIELAHSKNGNFISQQKYIIDLLKVTKMLGCKP